MLSSSSAPSALEQSAASVRVLSSWALWLHAVWAALTALKRQTTAVLLGFFAVLLVVVMIALLVSVTAQAPLVFLRLAEVSRGEVDAELRAGEWTGHSLLNYSQLALDLDALPATAAASSSHPYSRHSARFFYEPLIWRAHDCANQTLREAMENLDASMWASNVHVDVLKDCGWTNVSLSSAAEDEEAAAEEVGEADSALLIGLMSEREAAMELGRDWSLPAVPAAHVYVHARLLASLGASVGDVLLLGVDARNLVGRVEWQRLTGVWLSESSALTRVLVPVRVANSYAAASGKHSADAWRVLVTEFDAWWPHLLRSLSARHYSASNASASAALAALSMRAYADVVQVNLPSPRVRWYASDTYAATQQALLDWSAPLFLRLGFTRLLTSLPVLEALERTKFAGLFLALVLNVVVAVLLLLAVLLLHALLLVHVDTRQFELAVLRMLGAQRPALVQLLLAHALTLYSLPATLLGLALAELLALGVSAALSSLLGVSVSAPLTWSARALSAALGLSVPLFASLLPIASALAQSLASSLSARASRVLAVRVDLARADASSSPLSFQLVLVGAALALFGGVVYYALPLALLSLNLALLANIFLALLVGLLLGLTLLALNVQRVVERAVVAATLWWETRAVRALVHKNLTAHRPRNRQTAVLYALALAFILFVTVAYDLQMQTFQYRQQQERGAYVVVSCGYFVSNSERPHLASLAPALHSLESACLNSSACVSWAWLTQDVEDALLHAKSGGTALTSLAGLWKRTQDFTAATPNLFSVTLPQFLRVSAAHVDNERLLPHLLSREGRSGALVGSLYTSDLGLALNQDMLLSFTLRFRMRDVRTEAEYTVNHRLQPTAFLDAAPALKFSPFPAIKDQSALISLPMFMALTEGTYESVEELPYRSFLVQLRSLSDKAAVDELIAQLQDAVQGIETAYVWDYRAATAPLEKSSAVLAYVFSFTTVVAMAMCFFSLTSSMYTNVHEQSKEIAVLRALGLARTALYRLYVHEAFVLVLSSSLLGVGIGLVVSYTMTAQQILFTQLPIPFAFPWPVLVAVVVAAVVFAFLASFFPIYRLTQLKIVQIFRLVS